jgi:nuclear transport factor 2 (NTF2) superfamily protein
MAEDAWNARDPHRVAGAYTVDSGWRNRVEFPKERDQIVEFLQRKWARELDLSADQRNMDICGQQDCGTFA